MAMSVCLRTICLAFAVGSAAAAFAGDAYYNVPLQELKLVEGRLPVQKGGQDYQSYLWERARAMTARVVLDGPGEAYFMDNRGGPWVSGSLEAGPMAPTMYSDSRSFGLSRVLVRAAAGKGVTGRLVLGKFDLSGMVSLRFAIPASKADPKAKEEFYRHKIIHYNGLLSRQIPGGAWFRHQVRLARAELNIPSEIEGGAAHRLATRQDRRVARNLRSVHRRPGDEREPATRPRDAPGPPNETPVKVDSLTGITIKEIDWKPLIKDAKPKLDPLADKIPADQHVVFFPSFQAAVAVADETNRHDTPRAAAGPAAVGRRRSGPAIRAAAWAVDEHRWPGSWGRRWSRAWP